MRQPEAQDDHQQRTRNPNVKRAIQLDAPRAHQPQRNREERKDPTQGTPGADQAELVAWLWQMMEAKRVHQVKGRIEAGKIAGKAQEQPHEITSKTYGRQRGGPYQIDHRKEPVK